MGRACPWYNWLRGLAVATVDILIGRASSPFLGQDVLLEGHWSWPGLPTRCGKDDISCFGVMLFLTEAAHQVVQARATLEEHVLQWTDWEWLVHSDCWSGKSRARGVVAECQNQLPHATSQLR